MLTVPKRLAQVVELGVRLRSRGGRTGLLRLLGVAVLVAAEDVLQVLVLPRYVHGVQRSAGKRVVISHLCSLYTDLVTFGCQKMLHF